MSNKVETRKVEPVSEPLRRYEELTASPTGSPVPPIFVKPLVPPSPNGQAQPAAPGSPAQTKNGEAGGKE